LFPTTNLETLSWDRGHPVTDNSWEGGAILTSYHSDVPPVILGDWAVVTIYAAKIVFKLRWLVYLVGTGKAKGNQYHMRGALGGGWGG